MTGIFGVRAIKEMKFPEHDAYVQTGLPTPVPSLSMSIAGAGHGRFLLRWPVEKALLRKPEGN